MLFFINFIHVKAQVTAKDIFTSKEMVWYGIDFSHAKMVGEFVGTTQISGSEIKENFIPEWNQLILKEPQKFNLYTTFRKETVYKDLGSVTFNNENINAATIMSENIYEFKDPLTILIETVKNFKNNKIEKGIGLVFIVESFDKYKVESAIYITFFDIETKKIILAEKLNGIASGFGIRNYWSGSIYKIFKQIKSNMYSTWKTESK